MNLLIVSSKTVPGVVTEGRYWKEETEKWMSHGYFCQNLKTSALTSKSLPENSPLDISLDLDGGAVTAAAAPVKPL